MSAGLIRSVRGLAASVVVLAAAVHAWGQVRDNDIRVTILDVGYNSAYRNGTWVPVDVLVENEREDITGYLEVRTLWNYTQVQSPVYRVPVESPLHSRKRIRVHCLLKDAARVEAALYQRGRRVGEVPTWVDVTPIRPTDSLVLVMDEISGNYSFLYNVLQDASGERRVYRHELGTEGLSNLPGYATCYDAFDLIIMSEIDPGRIGVRHRELLRNYVESGGVLVAGIGESANVYRNSWVEELLGVRIGESQVVRETDYAPHVLPAGMAERANESRQYSVPALEPVVEDVKVFGQELPLATMRRVGSGAVVALAVDGPSKALQDTQGYHHLWRNLAALRQSRRDLDVGPAAQAVEQQLPWISGVRIQPKSTVMAYLGLYVLVGIVGNWLFWNYLKRREMAWVCLVLISIGFTTYAVTFGTLGRAKNSEISFIDVLEIPQGADTADRYSLAGVLTAGTARYAGSLSSDYALATEAGRLGGVAIYSQGRPIEASPFTFIEDDPARIENMRVGASELRLLHLQDEVPVPGSIEGALIHDDSGLHGTLVNRTGMDLASPVLYYLGHFYPLGRTDDGWSVNFPPPALEAQADVGFENHWFDLNYTQPWAGRGDGNIDSLRQRVMLLLMLQPTQGGQPTLDTQLGPFVMGWTTRALEPAFQLDEPIDVRMHETLVVTDVDVEHRGAAAEIPIPLHVQVTDVGYNRNPNSHQINAGTTIDAYISVPSSNADLASEFGPLRIEVQWYGDALPTKLYVRDLTSGKSVEVPKTAPEQGSNVDVYLLKDWQSYAKPQQGKVMVALLAPQGRDRVPVSGGEFTMRASVTRRFTNNAEGDWKSWPLSKPSN